MYQTFEIPGFQGELNERFRPTALDQAVHALIDPQNALETIHWGRNYLYRAQLETLGGPLEVVVKQFRNVGWRRRLERRWRGSKAARSWEIAKAFVERGIPTAEPILWIESTEPEGPSFFVSRYLAGRLEARYLFRARNENRLAETYPQLSSPEGFYREFLPLLAKAVRRLHDRGLFHRDLSIGNLLLPASLTLEGIDDIAIVDLNRARVRDALSVWERSRDLCRLTLLRAEDRRLFLDSYWCPEGGQAGAWRRWLFLLCHFGFRAKIATKKFLRAPLAGLGQWLAPRRAHVHIPEAPKDASKRDRIVWDYLSDQPHQHASRLDKLKVRCVDLPSHLAHNAFFAAAAPRIWRQYRQLRAELYREPVPFGGLGVGLRPYPPAPELVVDAVVELGIELALLRLHPWEEDFSAEWSLAQALHARGIELCFALPQNRELVRDPALWQKRVAALAEAFTPLGRDFIVGQAINRSKWGVWRSGEYRQLLAIAREELRARRPDVRILGPGVIDFELHATAAVVNDPRTPPLDGLASLLYVDRRGAPENRQLGFDTVGKVLLAQAIAASARRCHGPSWVTEVNWPLWEGPHSPAGKAVSVDEAHQADYLVRYFLLALTSGSCERVYWWQLIARGYGLMVPVGSDAPTLRRRPAFVALAVLQRELRGRWFFGPLRREDPARGIFLWHFGPPGQRERSALGPGHLVVGWALEPARTQLPDGLVPAAVITQDGQVEGVDGNLSLASAVRYFRI